MLDNYKTLKLIQNNPSFTGIPFGIHGRGHANRVLLFSSLLANIVDERVDTQAITIAALLHDCGRQNNGSETTTISGFPAKKLNVEGVINKTYSKKTIYITVKDNYAFEFVLSEFKNDFDSEELFEEIIKSIEFV